MTKQHKDNIGDDAQESLVQALESIKGLLEKSESKLSAARESIALANTSSKKARVKKDDDDDIPVLSDIVETDEVEEPQADLSIFEPMSAIVAETVAEPTPEIIAQAALPIEQGIASEDVLDLINEFQERMKPLINDAINSSSILQLEQVINEHLKKELHQLRNEIKQLDN